jgi:hypothetical protein
MAKQPTKNIPQAKPAQATVKTTAKPKQVQKAGFDYQAAKILHCCSTRPIT